jgi:hypothetical protein
MHRRSAFPRRTLFIAFMAAAVAVVLAAPLWALINPDYTPVHVAQQCPTILLLNIEPPEGMGEPAVSVARVLKGKAPERAPAILLSRSDAGVAAELRKAVGDRARTAILLELPAGDAAAGSPPPLAMLHVEMTWFRLFGNGKGAWAVERSEPALQGTWGGSTEMLARAVEYVLTDPDPAVPSKIDSVWGKRQRIAIAGKGPLGLVAVDPDGKGSLGIHVLSPDGDRFYRYDEAAGEMREAPWIAGERTLPRSRLAAWGPFRGAGTLDLATWEGGSAVVFYSRAAMPAGGGAVRSEVEIGSMPLGLAPFESASGGRANLLAATRGGPLSVAFQPAEPGSRGMAPLVEGTADAAALGAAGPCVVADLDGDGRADVLKPHSRGGLFYKATAAGRFAPPAPCGDVAAGENILGVFLGDYDADGLLDAWIVGGDGFRLWHNLGGGKFRDVFHESGEPAALAKGKPAGGASCDIDNDGRQDVVLAFADRAPQVYFNRGFRTFGLATTLSLDKDELFAGGGARGVAVGDFNGDGMQDLAVLTGGELVVYYREAGHGSRLAARVSLPPERPGPATVVGYDGSRCLGAQLVAPGGAAFFGKRNKGPLVLKWRIDGEEKSMTVLVLAPTAAVLPGPSK